MSRAREMDLTNGSIFKKLIIYAIPFIFTNILQILFNAADIAIVGIFVNDDAVAAVGANTSFNALLIGFFVGLSIGSNIVLSKYVGARDLESSRKTVGTSILVALIAGVFLALIGIPFAEKFLVWMKCDERILSQATLYLRIYFIGMPIMMLYNFSASILRAVGDTRRPLIYLTIGGVVNVVLNVFFVVCLGMTVEGVAIATIVSQAISATLTLITLFKSDGFGSLKLKYLKFYETQLKEILILGVPSGIQSVAFNISNVLIQSTINSLGDIAMSANTTAAQFDGICYNVGNAISMSTMAFVGQNIGAKRMDRVKVVIFNGAIIATIFTFGIGALFTLLSRFLCGIIATKEEVVEMASIRLTVMGLTYFLCAVMEVCSNSMRALGKPVVSLVISIMGATVFRMLFLEIAFTIIPEFYIIFVTYPISWLFTIIVYTFVLPSVYKKKKLEMESQTKTLKNT